MDIQEKQRAKQAAGEAAAQLVQNGMIIGLGTGSTAAYFIENLIVRCRQEGLRIHALPTSERSAQQAHAGGIPLCDPHTVTHLDLTIDGADEIDHQKRMIKGGGGALLREKISASISNEMIVIIDSDKLVTSLGGFPLPVEIIPFAYEATLAHIRRLGYDARLRTTKTGELYTTDNHNYLIDLTFSNGIASPEKEETALKKIPGVVETGFFFHLAGRVIIGQRDGSIQIIP